MGTLQHLVEGITDGHADAVLAASIFHFGEHTIAEAKAHMAAAGITVRPRLTITGHYRAGVAAKDDREKLPIKMLNDRILVRLTAEGSGAPRAGS